MNKVWYIPVSYGPHSLSLKAELEYESNQIQHIRVYGQKTTLLLENNYPMVKIGTGKKGIRWKIREGSFDQGGLKNAQLLARIFKELEYVIKHETN